MIKELMFKWFGLEELPCNACEVLKESLATERQLNKVLMDKLLNPVIEPKPPVAEIPPELVKPKFTPWRVRKQMLEQEDAKAAQVMKQKITEINQTENQTTDKLAPPDDPDVIALERELNIIEKAREDA